MGRVAPASKMEVTSNEVFCVVNTVPSPDAAAFTGFTAQAKPVCFESAEASSLHTLPFGFNPGDATTTQGVS